MIPDLLADNEPLVGGPCRKKGPLTGELAPVCGGEEVGIYYSTERERHDAKGTTNVYERVQAGSGAPGAEQCKFWNFVSGNRIITWLFQAF